MPSMRSPASMLVSCTSILLSRTSEFPRCTKKPTEVNFISLQELLRNRNPETIPACSIVQYFLHETTADNHSCCECTKSNGRGVCHRLLSTSWPLKQVCSHTIPYRVCQCASGAGMSRRFESKYVWHVSKRFQFFLLELVIIDAQCGDFIHLLDVLIANSQHRCTHFFACPSVV